MTRQEFYKRFSEIQKKLKVPKGNKNGFGNYNYRKAEDILKELKEHLNENECVFLDNEVIAIEGRFYCQATAIFTNGEYEIKAKGQAREEEIKKGMDGSQITGSATSYARKYALAGLFGVDNEKDADDFENNDSQQNKKPASNFNQKPSTTAKQTTPITKTKTFAEIKAEMENVKSMNDLKKLGIEVKKNLKITAEEKAILTEIYMAQSSKLNKNT